MTDLIIGIDPDLEKSGVAVLGRSLELKNLTFAQTVELFRSHQDEIKKVVIEAGWLNEKSNFRFGHSKNAGEKIAKNVGGEPRNRQIARRNGKRMRFSGGIG